MKIKVQSFSPNPVELCAKASYISHSEKKITEIFEGNAPKDPFAYLTKIVKMGHLSVLEHAYFNLLAEDAPAVFEIFAIRFRLASFTVKSRRYTNVLKDGFFKTQNTLDEGFLEKVTQFYEKLKANDIPLEDARFILPYSFKTNMILSLNARELGYMLYTALYENNVPEIKEIAKFIIHELKTDFPIFSENLEIFKKETLSLENLPFNPQTAAFKPMEEVVLLNSTANAESIYQDALYFMKQNNYYNDGRIDPGLLSESIGLFHNRALELVNYTFYVRGISLAGLTHLLRHRIQTPILPDLFNPELNYSLLMPKSIRVSGLREEFLELAKESAHLEKSTGNFYYRIVAAAFPVVFNMNLRELYLFFKLRLCERAQWEIREMADQMLSLAKEKNPLLFQKAGPSCVILGYCPEGSHSCGRMAEKKAKYLSL